MRKIILLCAQGMSTGVMVKRMRDYADQIGYECTISAHPIAEAGNVGADADAILLGPQVRFEKEAVIKKCPGVPVESIDMAAYGRLDGGKAIEQVRRMLND